MLKSPPNSDVQRACLWLAICVALASSAFYMLRPLPVLAKAADAPPQALGLRESGSAPLRMRFVNLEPIEGADPELPPQLVLRYRGETISASYTLCVLPSGKVLSVKLKSTVLEAEEHIVSTLRSWRFAPQPAGTLTCLQGTFHFEM